MSAVRYDLAMHSLNDGWLYQCLDTTYESITMLDDNPKPTAEALEAEWAAMETKRVAHERDMARRFAYPDLDELVVAMWEKLVETDGLTSDDIAAIQAKRVAVKKELP